MDLIVLDCPEYRSRSGSGKHRYVRTLVVFRLLIWMLQHPAVYQAMWRGIPCDIESSIGRHARLSFVWQLSTSLEKLNAALRGSVASDLPFLPDLRYKQWVQYLLDRVGQGLVKRRLLVRRVRLLKNHFLGLYNPLVLLEVSVTWATCLKLINVWKETNGVGRSAEELEMRVITAATSDLIKSHGSFSLYSLEGMGERLQVGRG